MNNDLSLTVDPLEDAMDTLYSFGSFSALNSVDIGRSFPIAGEDELMWHYLYGYGEPFINFLIFVDVGVGFQIEPVFEDKELGQEVKKDLEDWINKVEYLTTLMQYSAYRETLGRGCIALTRTADKSDFYYDDNIGITGVDCINPTSLDDEQLEKAIYDPKGKEEYLQVYTDYNGLEHRTMLSRDRVIYTTQNPFMKRSVRGVSAMSPAIGELRTAEKYHFHMERLAGKTSSLNRHFSIDTDKIGKMEQGKKILRSREKSREYMLRMYNLINKQQRNGGDVVTMDYITSSEHSYAGKIPDLSNMIKTTLEMIGTTMETPIHLFSFSKDVNRATLEMLSDIFLRRRVNGSQKHYIRISEKIFNEYIAMKGYGDGYVKVEFNPFLPEDILSMYDRLSNFVQKVPDGLSVTEIRRKISMPDEIEYGDADRQIDEAVRDLFNPNTSNIRAEPEDISNDGELEKEEIKKKVMELFDEKHN